MRISNELTSSLFTVQILFSFSVPESPEDLRKVRGDGFDPFFAFCPVGRVEYFVDGRVERLLLTQSFSNADNPPRFVGVFAVAEGILSQVGNKSDLISLSQDGDMHTLPLRLRVTQTGEGLASGEKETRQLRQNKHSLCRLGDTRCFCNGSRVYVL
jgi:hypothetical protein